MNYIIRIAIVLSSLPLGCAGARSSLPVGVDDVELACLVIEGAEVVPSKRRYEPTDEMTMQEQLALANQGHTIIKGNSTIIAVREFGGRNGAADGQRFRKLTVKLDGPLKTKEPIDVAESYFVSGSSAFVAWGLYYVSIDKLKELSVADRGAKRVLTVKQVLPSFRVPDGLKEDVNLNFECELKSKSLEQLSDWEGNPAAKRDPFYP